MNLRMFSIALMASAIPFSASARGGNTLTEADFLSAERKSRDGRAFVSVKLSKSGKAKLKKMSEAELDRRLRVEIDGTASEVRLRDLLSG